MVLRKRIAGLAIAAIAAVATGGCSGSDRVEVTGRVTRKADGTPLVGAKVAFRSEATGKAAIGYTDSNGKYTLGTERPGEGIPSGDYYVTVTEDRGPAENMRQPTVSAKYEIPSTAGLTYTVKPGGSNTYDIVLDRP
jgi:carboxypeptidase family protein